VHRALFRNLQQSGFLAVVQIADELYVALNLVQHPGIRIAVFTVAGMNPLVTKPDADLLKIHSFSVRIHAESDRSSCAERGQQIFVRRRPLVVATGGLGLITDQDMTADLYTLTKS
jgi:hypothetical protein